MQPRLLERYKSEVVAKLSDEFGYKNVHQVPRIEKIVVNVGLGEATQNPKLLEKAADELALITGQKASIRRARKSVANFKLRQGQAIGATVTLRRERMWEFFDRLVNVAHPRERDVHQPIEELPHALATEGHRGADGLALAQLEVRH